MSLLAKKIFSVHIHINAPNEHVYACCLLSRNNKQGIVVQQQVAGLVDPDDLFDRIPAGVPLVLNITGKGILIRQIPVQLGENQHIETMMQDYFPGVNPVEFNHQTYTDEENKVWITLVRKRVVDELLQLFTQKLHNPVYVSAGPFDLLNTPGYIAREHTYNGIQYTLSFRDKILEQITPVQADGVPVHQAGGNKAIEHAYAAALNWIYAKGEGGLNDATVANNRVNLRFINYTKLVGWSFLTGWLVILLVNFVLFNNLSANYADNTQKFEANASALRRMDSLQQQLREQKQFLKDHNLYTQTHFGFWADRLGASTGNHIVLTELAFFPLRESNDSILFDNDSVRIKGTANTIFYLNDWINKLKKEKWIRQITLENYDRTQTNAPGTFDVKLNLIKQNELDL